MAAFRERGNAARTVIEAFAALPHKVILMLGRAPATAGSLGLREGTSFFTGATAKQRKRGRRHFVRNAHALSREILFLIDGVRFAFLYDLGSMTASGAVSLILEMRRAADAIVDCGRKLCRQFLFLQGCKS